MRPTSRHVPSPAIMLAALLGTWLAAASGAVAGTVGFSRVEMPDGAGPPVELGIWYPADGAPRPTRVGLFEQPLLPDAPLKGRELPLVVISHGHGGDFSGHSDTALALAEAGFVVAAPTHPGDNYRDQSRALDVAGRAALLPRVVSYMIGNWVAHGVDPGRVGLFGFSSGGLSVLIAAGGTPELGRIADHCAHHVAFFDCQLIRAHPGGGAAPLAGLPHDTRIRAIAVAAPALGFAFGRDDLRAVKMPVQLWRAEVDQVLPAPFYADAVRAALPQPPEFHLVPHAGHFDFLAPCSVELARVAPGICTSEPGFDRAVFHRSFDASLVTFFTRTLGPVSDNNCNKD